MTDRRIAYPDDPLMAAAWLSAVTVAATHTEMLAAYEADTGRNLALASKRTPLDRLIDEATGAEAASVNDFVDWFNAAVWGEDVFNPAPLDLRPDRTGLDDGPYLPGCAPRKKAAPKLPDEIRAIRLAAWATRRLKYGPRGHR